MEKKQSRLLGWFQRRIEGLIPKGKFWWWKGIKLYFYIWVLVTVVKGFLMYIGRI